MFFSLCLLSFCRFHGNSSSDLSPSNQPPMFVNSSGQCDLLILLCADWCGEGNLGQVSLGGLLVALRPHAEEPPEEIVGDLELGEDVGQVTHGPQHLTHHPVRPAQGGVHLGAHPDEAAGHGVHQVILLREQGHDPAVDGLTGQLALAVLGHEARPDLDLLDTLLLEAPSTLSEPTVPTTTLTTSLDSSVTPTELSSQWSPLMSRLPG